MMIRWFFGSRDDESYDAYTNRRAFSQAFSIVWLIVGVILQIVANLGLLPQPLGGCLFVAVLVLILYSLVAFCRGTQPGLRAKLEDKLGEVDRLRVFHTLMKSYSVVGVRYVTLSSQRLDLFVIADLEGRSVNKSGILVAGLDDSYFKVELQVLDAASTFVIAVKVDRKWIQYSHHLHSQGEFKSWLEDLKLSIEKSYERESSELLELFLSRSSSLS